MQRPQHAKTPYIEANGSSPELLFFLEVIMRFKFEKKAQKLLDQLEKSEQKEILWNIYFSSLIIASVLYPDKESFFCLGWVAGFEIGYDTGKMSEKKINFFQERKKHIKRILENLDAPFRAALLCASYSSILGVLDKTRLELLSLFSDVPSYETQIMRNLLDQVRKEIERDAKKKND